MGSQVSRGPCLGGSQASRQVSSTSTPSFWWGAATASYQIEGLALLLSCIHCSKDTVQNLSGDLSCYELMLISP